MIISALPIDGRDYSKDQCPENYCEISVLPSSPRSLSLQCLSILPEQRRYWKSLPDWTSLARRSVWGKGEFVWNVFGVQTAVKEEGVVANLVESSLAGLLHLSNHPFNAHFLAESEKKDFWKLKIEKFWKIFFRPPIFLSNLKKKDFWKLKIVENICQTLPACSNASCAYFV